MIGMTMCSGSRAHNGKIVVAGVKQPGDMA